jgi:hypothetical protein
MYELVYILFYYCILLSLLYCYKRYKEQQSRVEYEYTQIELISEKGDKE